MAFWKCPRCSGSTDKIGEHIEGATATFKCEKDPCGYVFLMPNIRKTFSIPGMSPGGRDYSAAIDHCKTLQAQMEKTWGVQGSQNVMRNRMQLLADFFASHGVRTGADFLHLLRESQSGR